MFGIYHTVSFKVKRYGSDFLKWSCMRYFTVVSVLPTVDVNTSQFVEAVSLTLFTVVHYLTSYTKTSAASPN